MSRKKKKEYQSILNDTKENQVEETSDIDEFSLRSPVDQEKEENAQQQGPEIVKEDGDWVWVKIDKEMLCRECGENERDLSRGPDFPLCKKCAKQQYRYPINGWVLLLALVLLLSAVLGGFMLPASAENGKAIHTADAYLEQNQLSSAGTAYAQLYDKDESNKYVAKRLVEILYRAGNWQNIVEVINTTFSSSDLKLKTNEGLAEIYNEVALYNRTNEELEKMYTELGTDATYDEVVSKLDGMQGASYSQVCVEYYRYKFAVMFHREKAEIYAMISQTYDSYPEYGWLLLGPKASAQRQMQLYEDAITSATQLLEQNTENAEAYRQLAIAYLLKEDYESAIGFATRSYLLKKTDDVGNVLLAAYLATGDEEQYESFLTEMTDSGLEPDYFIYQLQSGETTIKEAFLEGEE